MMCDIPYSTSHLNNTIKLLDVTDREYVGTYLGHPIFKVKSLIRVFPCDHSLKTSPKEQVKYLCGRIKMESKIANLFKVAEKTRGFCFFI